MPAPNPIHTFGTILEPAGPRCYRTALPNGKEILAHIPHKHVAALGDLEPKAQVKLEMTSYDFSIGRITGLAALPFGTLIGKEIEGPPYA